MNAVRWYAEIELQFHYRVNFICGTHSAEQEKVMTGIVGDMQGIWQEHSIPFSGLILIGIYQVYLFQVWLWQGFDKDLTKQPKIWKRCSCDRHMTSIWQKRGDLWTGLGFQRFGAGSAARRLGVGACQAEPKPWSLPVPVCPGSSEDRLTGY